ncbi:MAG: acetyl-CoA carboxylase biotin carboxyl carrier protein subunit [Deltaproteobacteria bacterium]|nr:acetyl-CoA carboxylase biotin carboxyl carrier protein subunit [Deltaproteobacteria bacterium]
MATQIYAPLDGKIARIFIKIGDQVEKDEPVATIEALKNEMPIHSPVDGTIKQLCITEGQEVKTDALLMVIDQS